MTTTSTAPSTAPSHGANHPIALCFHSVNNVAQIVNTLLDDFVGTFTEGDPARTDTLRVRELLADAAFHLGALNVLFERQERLIEEQRGECLREKRYSTRVEEANSKLVQELIDLAHDSADERTAFAPPALVTSNYARPLGVSPSFRSEI